MSNARDKLITGGMCPANIFRIAFLYCLSPQFTVNKRCRLLAPRDLVFFFKVPEWERINWAAFRLAYRGETVRFGLGVTKFGNLVFSTPRLSESPPPGLLGLVRPLLFRPSWRSPSWHKIVLAIPTGLKSTCGSGAAFNRR